MQLSAGLYDVWDARIAESPAELLHFKYHAGFHKKVMDEIGRNQHFDDSAEYRAYAEALGGRVQLLLQQGRLGPLGSGRDHQVHPVGRFFLHSS
jgi:hypothetical protein